MSGSMGKKKELMVQMLTATVGSLMFAIGVNLIIVPLGLYNGADISEEFDSVYVHPQYSRST